VGTFWWGDITLRIVTIPYRHFRTSCRVPSSKVTSCSETSARNYHYRLHMIPEERRSHLLPGGSLNHAWTFYLTENAASNFRVWSRSCETFANNSKITRRNALENTRSSFRSRGTQ